MWIAGVVVGETATEARWNALTSCRGTPERRRRMDAVGGELFMEKRMKKSWLIGCLLTLTSSCLLAADPVPGSACSEAGLTVTTADGSALVCAKDQKSKGTVWTVSLLSPAANEGASCWGSQEKAIPNQYGMVCYQGVFVSKGNMQLIMKA